MIFDLFGNPVRAGKGKRGRPAFEVTERNRNKVKLLLAQGKSNQIIADAIGCSLATLKRHFRAVLEEREKARAQMDAEQMMMVWEQAAKGNVGAMRLFVQLMDRSDRMEVERQLAQQVRGEKVGKKEERALAAKDAEAELMAELQLEARGDVRH
ncbi:hypothetical protein [Gemmobacter nectariphilus]|uniref:hypothetical protein n=1 Tax=Gemmobacter nectariphilus TaxID=220343 RepID=UPI001FE18B12|nr:hypothetical protein [Gemmobacter nectariphilus]